VTGKAILLALENAVSQYPALEGRFPQVSNIEFEFDPNKPQNARVTYAKIGEEPLDEKKLYTLVTRGYMARGKDGFDSLLVKSEGGEAEEIVSEENGILISMLLRQYFMSLKIMGQWKRWGKSMDRHWKGVQNSMDATQPTREPQSPSVLRPAAPDRDGAAQSDTQKMTAPLVTDDSTDDSDDDVGQDRAIEDSEASITQQERKLKIARKITKKWWRLAGLSGQPKCCDEVTEFHIDWTRVSHTFFLLRSLYGRE
jgi:hypothetical protein